MMSSGTNTDVVISVDKLSKRYKLGIYDTTSFIKGFFRSLKSIFRKGRQDTVFKNERNKTIQSEYIWALKDISFEVNKGDVLAVLGSNGSGKSTLLKLLSRITYPTEGNITIRNRITSLLEVGAGFHNELTGRENIYLSGSILGMSLNKIKQAFPDIIEFSGCRGYIDTPIKRYSSGMLVRLGFAIGVFLNSEVLILDEVLAVGDKEFQKEAIKKIKQLVQEKNKTIIFVSHDMDLVKSFCKKGLVLNQGELVFNGGIEQAIETYYNLVLPDDTTEMNTVVSLQNVKVQSPILIHSITVKNSKNNVYRNLFFKETFHIDVSFTTTTKRPFTIILKILNASNLYLVSSIVLSAQVHDIFEGKKHLASTTVRDNTLLPGKYLVMFEVYNDINILLNYSSDFFDLHIKDQNMEGEELIPKEFTLNNCGFLSHDGVSVT